MSPRLFLQVLSVEARKLMSYRADFWLQTIAAFAADLAVAFFLWRAVFEASGREEIGGFSFDGMVAYYVLAILLGKLVRGEERAVGMAKDVYQGSLTRYLLYPAPYFGFKYAEHLGTLVPAVIQLVLLGAVSFTLFPWPAELAATPWTVLGTLAAVAVGNLLALLLVYPVQGVAFWADNVWSLSFMLRFTAELLGGLLLPLSVFPDAVRRVLELLPFQYLFYFPVSTLTGRLSLEEWLVGMAVAVGWCVVLGLVGRVVWRRGYLEYTGVGI